MWRDFKIQRKDNYDDLTYHYKDEDIYEKSCNNFYNVFSFLKTIRDGKITLEKEKKITMN